MHWEEALCLLQEMLHRSLAPNAVSHSAAIGACEKGMQIKSRKKLVDMNIGVIGCDPLIRWLERSLTPGMVSRSAAISACEKGKHWEEALRLLREITQISLTLDMIS